MLELQSKTYADIIYVLWCLLEYFSSMLGGYAGDIFADIICDHPQKPIYRENSLTYIYVKEQRLSLDTPPPERLEEIRKVMQDYLTIVLLPQYKEIRPYAVAPSDGYVYEALYLEEITYDTEYFYFKVLYVDSPYAQSHMLHHNNSHTQI